MVEINPFAVSQTIQNAAGNRERLAQLAQQRQWAAEDRPMQQRMAQLNVQQAEEQAAASPYREKMRNLQFDMQSNAYNSKLRNERMKYGANVYRQIQQNPQQAEQIYQSALKFQADQGVDVSMLPQQYDENAAMILQNMHEQVYNPMTAGVSGVRQPELTADQKNFQQYQQMVQANDPNAEAFGRSTGILSREGQDLSSNMEKEMIASVNAAEQADRNAMSYMNLADEMEKANFGGGLYASWKELYKDATGTQDAVSELRRRYNGIRASQAVSSLPPGAASDKDIALALSGFPPENARGDTMASFLRGLAKMENEAKLFNEFKSDFIAENGSIRTRGGKSLTAEWKANQEQRWPDTRNIEAQQTVERIEREAQQGMQRVQRNQAPSYALEALRNNPELIDQFEEHYGFRPEGF